MTYNLSPYSRDEFNLLRPKKKREGGRKDCINGVEELSSPGAPLLIKCPPHLEGAAPFSAQCLVGRNSAVLLKKPALISFPDYDYDDEYQEGEEAEDQKEREENKQKEVEKEENERNGRGGGGGEEEKEETEGEKGEDYAEPHQDLPE